MLPGPLQTPILVDFEETMGKDCLDTIRGLLATDTFEDGAAWFKSHPQQGNAYYFSKEVNTVYTMSIGLAQRGFRINA